MLQMFWAIGAIIVGGVTYYYEDLESDLAYRYAALRYRCEIPAVGKDVLMENTRVPIALQWMFPTPLAILIWLAPESPWWLTRKGRYEDAAKAVGRLGNKTKLQANNESVAMMRRTIDLEKDLSNPSLLELWKGTDRYRTLIVCGVYAAQNLTGNLIANRKILPLPSFW